MNVYGAIAAIFLAGVAVGAAAAILITNWLKNAEN